MRYFKLLFIEIFLALFNLRRSPTHQQSSSQSNRTEAERKGTDRRRWRTIRAETPHTRRVGSPWQVSLVRWTMQTRPLAQRQATKATECDTPQWHLIVTQIQISRFSSSTLHLRCKLSLVIKRTWIMEWTLKHLCMRSLEAKKDRKPSKSQALSLAAILSKSSRKCRFLSLQILLPISLLPLRETSEAAPSNCLPTRSRCSRWPPRTWTTRWQPWWTRASRRRPHLWSTTSWIRTIASTISLRSSRISRKTTTTRPR